MKYVKKINLNWLEKAYSYIFFFFFIYQILSPMINGISLYIEVVIAIFNPFFWHWIKLKKIKSSYMKIVLLLLFIIALGHGITSLKICTNLFYVIYLTYLWKRDLWKMDGFIYLSIGFAVVQFIFLFVDPEISIFLGPGNITNMVWGGYATATYTNFYNIFEFGIPHVSGLAREAGFMASILIVYIWHRINVFHECFYGSRWSRIWILIGYILSFSKMSLVLLPMYMIHKASYVVNKIPVVYVWVGFLCCMLYFWNGNIDFLVDSGNETFLSRFGAYPTLLNVDLDQFIFGERNLDKIISYVAITEFYGENIFSGLGGWLLSNGLLVGITVVYMLYLMKISTSGILLLLLATINVQIDTNQNFVALAWYIVFTYYRQYDCLDYENNEDAKLYLLKKEKV